MTLKVPSIIDTQQYPFAALREMWETGLVQSGVVYKGDFALTPKGSQPPMGVTVAAGEAWIRSTSVARKGAYHVTNDAAVDVLLATADATNPRIDRIVITVYDTGDLGSVTDGAVLTAVPGTPTAGATLVNLNGAPAQPADSLTLGFVLVAAGVTSVAAPAIGNYGDPWGTLEAGTTPAIAGAIAGAPPPFAFGRPANFIPNFHGYNSAAQSIATSTNVAVALNVEKVDNDGGHDTVTNNSRFVCKTPGLYQIIGSLAWAANTSGFRAVNLRLNGGPLAGQVNAPPNIGGVGTTQIASRLFRLGFGDYVETVAVQGSGGALSLSASTGEGNADLQALWVAP